MDWGPWSRDAVALMAARTREQLAAGLAKGNAYHWDLEAAVLIIGELRFRVVTIGTTAGDSFLWAWANEAIPAAARRGLERVRDFGVEHDLPLLSEACAPGGLAQAKECLAIAGRVLDADAVFIDQTQAGYILFALFTAAPSS